MNLNGQRSIRAHPAAARDPGCSKAGIPRDILGHQSTARKSVGGDLRGLEALVIRTARLAVLGDGPGDVIEEGFSVLPACASIGTARRAVCDDEETPRSDLAHGRLVRV